MLQEIGLGELERSHGQMAPVDQHRVDVTMNNGAIAETHGTEEAEDASMIAVPHNPMRAVYHKDRDRGTDHLGRTTARLGLEAHPNRSSPATENWA